MVRILAALTFFTRLPFWRLLDIPADAYRNIVAYWPLTGWLTAGVGVFVLYAASLCLPPAVALLLAMASRLVLTGCLHEDGLADCCDAFGGGAKDRMRILAIMKDSRIGSYGVIGLLFYFALYFALLHSLPIEAAGMAMLVADPLAKGAASQIINALPYARTAAEAKSHTVYSRMNRREILLSFAAALASLVWLPSPIYLLAVPVPYLAALLLFRFYKQKIQGYTGDCCGATFLLSELAFLLAYVGIWQWQS